MVPLPKADPRTVLTRAARPADAVLPYGPHPEALADAFLPPGSSRPQATILLLHGGFWQVEYDRGHLRPLAAALADDGYAVLLPEFRRIGSPDGGWPGTFDDVAAVADAVPQLTAQLGLSDAAQRIVTMGHSAGGHLALWLAVRHRLPPGTRWATAAPADPRGVLALAPVADLVAAARDRLEDDAAVRLLGGTPEDWPERYAIASPAGLVPLGCPLTVVHGTADEQVPVAYGREFARVAAAAGDAVTYTELPGVEHFALIDPESTVWPVVRGAVATLAGGADAG